MNIFERASRAKTRFQTTKGYLSTEDLWDLSLESLDRIARAVNKGIKDQGEESFIDDKTPANTEENLKLEILKYVIASKKTAQEAAKKTAETKARIERIQNIIVDKQDKALTEKSVDELQAELEQLKA